MIYQKKSDNLLYIYIYRFCRKQYVVWGAVKVDINRLNIKLKLNNIYSLNITSSSSFCKCYDKYVL